MSTSSRPVRVRLAPSPTGDAHIGTMWLGQWNWLFAKQQGGKFILRIEDTDQKRFVEGSTEKIYAALDWLGMTPDEGPLQGGSYGPYIQSQRLELYKKAADELVAKGHAYHCFCSPERLTELRERQTAAKLPPRYDKHCLSLKPEEVKAKLEAGEGSTIRLNMPSEGSIEHHDIIRGTVTFQYSTIDDSVLWKSDGFPTYHLAVVVDDHAMEISHVIRAEEWLPSVPKHLYLYQCFGWEAPEFAHLPLILGTDKTKLSKRHGAVSALQYRDDGYLALTMQNFLALMGWHPKGDQEILTREEVIQSFKLGDIHPSGAVFDQQKLDWMQGIYIRSLSVSDLREAVQPFWNLTDEQRANTAWQEKIIAAIQDRFIRLTEISEATNVFLPEWWNTTVATFDLAILIPKKGTKESAMSALQWFTKHLEESDQSLFDDASKLREDSLAAIAAAGFSNAEILWPVRVAISLQKNSPDVFAMIYALGQEETLRRLRTIG